MDLEVRHYRYFVALAEALHFGRAAERLGISQPALSQQLRWIEQRVGAPLLARGGRRLALTEVGAVLLREAQDVLRRLQLAELATARASRGETGSIAIGYVASAALSGLLPRLIHRFRQDHPDVQFSLREMEMPLQLTRLADGELDLGFVRPPLPGLPEGVALLEVADEPVVLAVHAGHALARQAVVDPARLRGETFLCTHTQEGTGFYAITQAVCASAGFAPRVETLSPQMSTIVSMVAAGFGVALVPESMRAFAPPDVVYRPLAQQAVRSPLAVAHRRNVQAPAVLRLLERCRAGRPARREAGGAQPPL
ncbi:LysR family transcriptional regulator [Cupriavidus sp. USMAHM13]|uniref:LysR family transcriptional regulator n=1 Tax=Cupriavidus sp. USMAHM13 TaxID=1389192 RepID=UPI0008A6E78A|nr:LysR family transcriptional regulator [Cupriavidus sp. USMAHM13]AOZ00949.1 LysR family transcriptional regulator [Cupriavidus sp. USMAHM13]